MFMEIKLNSFLPCQSTYKKIEVFGYNSKSQPGLEITGINGRGKTIKEKFIFLSKKRKLRYPLKRFVLCVEGENLDKCQLDYLELPLLICFWSMANLLPLKRLDNCYASAKVSLDGEINHWEAPDGLWQDLRYQDELRKERSIYLGPSKINGSDFETIDVADMLDQSVGSFK